MAQPPAHPTFFPADLNFVNGPQLLTYRQRMENRLIRLAAEEHNARARCANRTMYLSHTVYVFIPMQAEHGGSIPTHPRTLEDVININQNVFNAFSAFYGLTHISWLAYHTAATAQRRRRKVLAFLGAIDF